MSGIFISQGMTIGLPPDGVALTIGEDGRALNSLTFHVHFDVTPTWCEIALRHLKDAKEWEAKRNAAWSSNDDSLKGPTLEGEFEMSMQASMAAAIAFDAFYACILSRIKLPRAQIEQWRTNRTARHRQIAEVVRRAFRLRPSGVKILLNCSGCAIWQFTPRGTLPRRYCIPI
jgi:hypothetical protein